MVKWFYENRENIESVYQKFTDKEMSSFFKIFFGNRVGKEYWSIYHHKGKTLLFAAKDNNKIVGAIRLHLEYKVARVGVFVVATEKRHCGIGSMLLKKCERLAKQYKCEKIWLHALPTTPAYRFYISCGYSKETYLRKHFGGKDLCIMSKFL